jgi:hypothetical protein
MISYPILVQVLPGDDERPEALSKDAHGQRVADHRLEIQQLWVQVDWGQGACHIENENVEKMDNLGDKMCQIYCRVTIILTLKELCVSE